MANIFRRVTEKLFPSRKAPAQTTTQARHVRDRQFGGSTKDMAREFGVSQRTVERWIKGDRTPRGKDATKLETTAAQVQVTERGRERKARQLEKEAPTAPAGLTLRVRLNGGDLDMSGSDVVRHGSRTIVHQLTNADAAALVRSGDPDAVDAAVTDALAGYFGVDRGSLTYRGSYDVDVL